MKNLKKIIPIIILLVIVIVIILSFLSHNKTNNKSNRSYELTYKEEQSTYNIYKTKDNKVSVNAEVQVVCIQAPCNPEKHSVKIEFNNNGMKAVSNFIESFFLNNDVDKIELKKEELTENQLNILYAIIYNDESYLTKESDRKLLFTVQEQKLKCEQPTLYVYSDNTYEYYDTYVSCDSDLELSDCPKPKPKKGKYNYNINLILSNMGENEDPKGSLILKDNNKITHTFNEYTYLEEFLDEININIHTCLKQES